MVAMRIDYADAAPLYDILSSEVFDVFRFAAAGRADDMGVCQPSAQGQAHRLSPLVAADHDGATVGSGRQSRTQHREALRDCLANRNMPRVGTFDN